MGTRVSILVCGEDRESAEKAIESALDEMRRVEAIMTHRREDSPLGLLNRSAGRSPVPLPAEVLDLLVEAKHVHALTDGAFDVTFGPLGDLWDAVKRTRHVPAPAEIRDELSRVGSRLLDIDSRNGTAHLRKKGMRVGLGGIAKGYAADRAARVLREAGFRDFAVDAGGDLVLGERRAGKPWRVGIRHPRDPARNVAIVPVANGAVATSGDAERYFVLEGKRYGHILDPRTGRPADRCQSVTVIGPHAYFADAMATGVFVLGPEKGISLLESLEGMEGIVLDSAGAIHVTSGLRSHTPPP